MKKDKIKFPQATACKRRTVKIAILRVLVNDMSIKETLAEMGGIVVVLEGVADLLKVTLEVILRVREAVVIADAVFIMDEEVGAVACVVEGTEDTGVPLVKFGGITETIVVAPDGCTATDVTGTRGTATTSGLTEGETSLACSTGAAEAAGATAVSAGGIAGAAVSTRLATGSRTIFFSLAAGSTTARLIGGEARAIG